MEKLVYAAAMSVCLAAPVQETVQPMVLVTENDVPQIFALSFDADIAQPDKHPISIYHRLKEDFDISHSEFAKWLGTKRRTFYNWKNEPEKASHTAPEIERRLATLKALRDGMEPEHHAFLYKVAFSSIFGNPAFGKAILEGADQESLLQHYDSSFTKFEAMRRKAIRKSMMS